MEITIHEVSWSLPTVYRGYPTILHTNNGINSVFDELLSSLFWLIGGIVHRGIVGSRSIHSGIPVYSRHLFHLPLKDTRFYHEKTKKTRAPCLYYPNSSAPRQLLVRGGDVSVNPCPSTKDCHLKCLSLNSRSLKSKHKSPGSEMCCQIHAFQKLVYSNAYDIICVTETWLKDFFLDSEILDTGYTIFRRDRAEREGGGVLIAVKDNLDCRRTSDLESGLEMLCVELNLECSSKIVISAIYRPPDSTPSYDFHSVAEFTSHLNNSAHLL